MVFFLLLLFSVKPQTLTYPWKSILILDSLWNFGKTLKGALVVPTSYGDSMLSSACWNFSPFKEPSWDVTEACWSDGGLHWCIFRSTASAALSLAQVVSFHSVSKRSHPGQILPVVGTSAAFVIHLPCISSMWLSEVCGTLLSQTSWKLEIQVIA